MISSTRRIRICPIVFMCDHSKCFNMELLASFDEMNSASSGKIIPIIFPLNLKCLTRHLNTPASHIIMSCILLHLFVSYLSLPPPALFSGRPRDADRPGVLPLRRPLFQCRASRQATPLIIQISPTLSLYILALVAAAVITLSVAPILMHSLSLYLLLILYLQSYYA